MSRNINDDVTDLSLSIEGLRFEKNALRPLAGPRGWFTSKLSSSPGPLVSDFVTHEEGFRYATYGIHVGQDDRLTFMGDSGKLIEGYFVDCRADSPTFHGFAHIRFIPSLTRRLVIPRGVAHTFDNLEGIVTRDEPVWYSDEGNDAWNIDNDLISVQRDRDVDSFPAIRGNRHLLPDDVHLFMSRLSQSLLENPKAYLARYLLKIGGKEQYVMFEPSLWARDHAEVRGLTSRTRIPGVAIRRARYALTGPRSWTLVPSTSACVADVLQLPTRKSRVAPTFLHARTRKYYTVLSERDADLTLSSVDCRRGSKHLGRKSEVSIRCDPRVVIIIDPGIAYSLRCPEPLLIRCEHEVFADAREPRHDIPMFGQDLIPFSARHRTRGLDVPDLVCPDSVLYAMAKYEVGVFESESSYQTTS
jgi:dTDP-4-dehydrorhamnose 3,5-epimerase-like enzyme